MLKSYGTNRDAIECANSEIQKYAVGNFIRIREYKGGDDPATETVYRVKQMSLGSCSFFSTNAPVFIVEDIRTGAELNLIRFGEAHRTRTGGYYNACVWPFAFYNYLTHRYDGQFDCRAHGGCGSIQIWKLDNVEAKQAISKAIDEKRRLQEWQREQEKTKKEKEEQAVRRQRENESISVGDLNNLLNELRE